MKRFCGISALISCFACVLSCDVLGEGRVDSSRGTLCVVFDESVSRMTKSEVSLPDTSEFLLKITEASGKIVYDGKFGDCPETISVAPGSYNVSTRSMEFDRPAFSSPQFGDEQCVLVSKGGNVKVKLLCSQLNAGVSLDVDPRFLTSYPDAVLFLKSAEGRLMYSYREERYAYFKPGPVSVLMNTGAGDQVLMSRSLSPCEMLDLKVRVPEAAASDASSINISIDTTRLWVSDELTIGQSDKGSQADDAYGVAQARTLAGEEDVWVCGYIVGGDLTSASASFEPPFESRTCILLGSRSSVSDRSSCISVQLPSGDVREMLNLVDNPSRLGQRVYVRGDLVESYYGIPGMKNTSECVVL